jgi:hypothetical protein
LSGVSALRRLAGSCICRWPPTGAAGIEAFKMTPADDHLNDLRKDEWRSMGFQLAVG